MNAQLKLARQLRQNMTPAEKLLWTRLRDRRFAGFEFRRQYPIEPYIVDFCCERCRLIKELDGEAHLAKTEADSQRIGALMDRGFEVLHFWNNLVYDDLETVLEKIYQVCTKRHTPHP